MNANRPPGLAMSIVLAALAIGAAWSGVDAIVSESVTTPSRFGGGKRVHGVDTVWVGVGWLLMGLALAAKVLIRQSNGFAGSAVAVLLIVIGAAFWFIAV